MTASRVRGFLMVEVLVGLALIAVVFGTLIPLTRILSDSGKTQESLLANMALQRGVEDQFYAQWQRLGRFGCSDDGRTIEIGSSFNRPKGIAESSFEHQSDWLRGADVGSCAAYGQLEGDKLSVRLPCDGISIGQRLQVSACSGSQQATVLAQADGAFVASIKGNQQGLNNTVLVGTLSDFYWYLAKGKLEQNALWRKPERGGNGIELFPNLHAMRIYPILDRDQDGRSDEIVTRYGIYPVSEMMGLLIEYLIQLPECQMKPSSEQTHRTLRGDTWRFDESCRSVESLIVPMGGVL